MNSSNEWQWPFKCVGCGESYPPDSVPFQCPRCGSIFELRIDLPYNLESESSNLPSLIRYRDSLPLPMQAELITLGEGDTPLVTSSIQGRPIHFKCEHLNPTGSFKDRGTAVLVSALKYLGIHSAVEDSSGNAGASFAAYAAHANIAAKIYIPDYASGPKRNQLAAYGSKIIPIPGPRSAATEAVLEAVDAGATYASHAYLPHGIAGMATVAFEIVQQLGEVPGSILTPVGQGSMLLGLAYGFQSMMQAGRIDSMPQLIAVQAAACAPIWADFKSPEVDKPRIEENETIAEGIRILNPLRKDGVIAAIRKTEGVAVAVEEEEILSGWKALGRLGFYVEPTSAVVWSGLMKSWDQLRDPVVVILTGTGLKSVLS
jgi:threonine synthase